MNRACVQGVTDQELREQLGNRYPEFMEWMCGQTMSICEARVYNHDLRQYEPSACTEPHGMVVYQWDLDRFLRGLPIID